MLRQVAWGYKHIRIQMDKVANALSSDVTVDSGISVLRRVKRLLRTEGQWNIKYVNRECNLIANHLAKHSLSWKAPLQLLEAPPASIATSIQHDKAFRFS
ncbi:hypothetical protein J1N35_045150 [Gossypium stocksii]|uniref:RNase H type-1 domain-containing protein n=1 Tax=Gossypium stocksii TaxID=47602 RepID=A0A9D3ZGQ4_9ROSI|nr:hypothetical protein J1N35_045150 [Gossypium stocksii]